MQAFRDYVLGSMVCVLLGATVPACSGDDNAGAPSRDAAVTPRDGGSDAAPPSETVSVAGQIVEAMVDGTFVPYPGAEVCVLDSDPQRCATADGEGVVELDLPANAQTGLTTERDGFVPMLTPITTGDSDIDIAGRADWANTAASVLIAQATLETFIATTGATVDPDKGQADMLAITLNGGTVTLEGAGAELGWFTVAGVPMRADGEAPAGAVLHGFSNIDPGMVTFRAEKNGAACEWDPLVWAGDDPGTVSVPIRAGWWTRLMQVRCE